MIALSVVNWPMAESGWTFAEAPGVVPDPIHGCRRFAAPHAAPPQG